MSKSHGVGGRGPGVGGRGQSIKRRPQGRGKDAHHNEWLSLVEVSGPFLSMPVLHKYLPQGLGDPSHLDGAQLRAVYQEWQEGASDPAIHRAWIRFVLRDVLEYPEEALKEGQQLPPGLEARLEVHGETLRPDVAVVDPAPPIPGSGAVRILFAAHPPGQDLDKPLLGLRWTASPQVRMMELLRSLDLRLGLVTNGERWIVVHAAPNETPAFVTWYAELWTEEPLALRSFWELLSVRRTLGADDERLEALVAESAKDQQEVTDQLGRQVRRAVELLVSAMDRTDRSSGRLLLEGVPEARLFDAALTVMMRLVFLMAAEERRLLPLDAPVYQENYAVSTLGQQLREVADRQTEEVLERRHDAWCRLLATFRAVHGGLRHEDLHLPAYGGSLFDPDRFPFLEGRAPGTAWKRDEAHPLPLDNRVVLYCLEALQLLQVGTGDRQEARRVSFRALDVEQIGHVYEGLLDHAVRRAEGVVLGLEGSKDSEAEVPVERLETARALGEDGLVEFLQEETKRGEAVLRKAMAPPPPPREGGTSYELTPDDHRLLVACDNDAGRYGQVAPYAALLRKDPFGDPVVIPPGGYYVTQGTDRRATGTHYTPRSLTEEIVTHTLDPLVYRGMAEGIEPDPATLRDPEEMLELKVCDIAMGSGAFLVQACRYLAEKLLEAWARREAENPGRFLVRPTGAVGHGQVGEEPLPTEPSERLLHAKRLVAERCLYGVDKDPRAVEMAKLSLWLETMAQGKPFSFLDHALRWGDSLLGLRSEEQLEFFHPRPEGRSLTRFLFWPTLKDTLDRARRLRSELESQETVDEKDTAAKQALLRAATEATGVARLLGDVLIGAELACASQSEAVRDRLLDDLGLLAAVVADFGKPEEERGKAAETLRRRARGLLDEGRPVGQGERRPFHWVVEFPEVFAGETGGHCGFDGIVGNPPFIGGKRITGVLGTEYRDCLVTHVAHDTKGHADICAYFFLRAGSLLRFGGQFGLIATNTIAQGDTREVGLDRLAGDGYALPRAVSSEKWPGTANLEVSKVWARRGSWVGRHVLNGQRVRAISSFLTVPGRVEGNPYRLAANAGKSFQGSIVLGMGFVLEPDEAAQLIRLNPRNREVLFPYMNGEDLNSRPDQSPSRWVINFFDWPPERAERYSEPWTIIQEKVKPERQRCNPDGTYVLRKPLPNRYWHYCDKRPALYSTITGMDRLLVFAQTSRTKYPTFVPNGWIYGHKVVVIAFDEAAIFSVLCSHLHYHWVIMYGSSLRTDPVYTPSDCFETFPFPASLAGLEAIGERYHEHRRLLMLEHQEGLTKTYNRFHNPAEKRADILHLRDLHVQMDRAVADAYGWTDLDLGHGFHDTAQGLRHTICPPARREVLDRLLELNHQRHAEEVAQGLHDKGKPKGKKADRTGGNRATMTPNKTEGQLEFDL